jgi:hypothetical protein
MISCPNLIFDMFKFGHFSSFSHFIKFFLGFLSFFEKLLISFAENNLIMQEFEQSFFDDLVTRMSLVFVLSRAHKYMRM